MAGFMINFQKIFRMTFLQKQLWTAAFYSFNLTIQTANYVLHFL